METQKLLNYYNHKKIQIRQKHVYVRKPTPTIMIMNVVQIKK